MTFQEEMQELSKAFADLWASIIKELIKTWRGIKRWLPYETLPMGCAVLIALAASLIVVNVVFLALSALE